MKNPFIFILALLFFGFAASAFADSPPDKDDIGYTVADDISPQAVLTVEAVDFQEAGAVPLDFSYSGTFETPKTEVINPADFAEPYALQYRQVNEVGLNYKKSLGSNFANPPLNHSSGGLSRLCA